MRLAHLPCTGPQTTTLTKEEFEDTKGVIRIEEEQTTQWPKEKVQKDKQRTTKHTHKTKDRVTGTPLKAGGEFRCSGKVSRSCSIIGTVVLNCFDCYKEKGEIMDEIGKFALHRATNGHAYQPAAHQELQVCVFLQLRRVWHYPYTIYAIKSHVPSHHF
jgi:hypothetical protein